MIIIDILLILLFSFIFSETLNYFLHRMLHSEKFRILSDAHMLHHIKSYNPKNKQLSVKYKSSDKTKRSFQGIGLEYFVIIPIIIVIYLISYFFSLSLVYTSIFIVCSLIYSYATFRNIHEEIHTKESKLKKIKFIDSWFKQLRHYHFIHHTHISDDGKLNVNYGICFYFLDKVFGSLKDKPEQFNDKGYENLLKRYSYLLEDK